MLHTDFGFNIDACISYSIGFFSLQGVFIGYLVVRNHLYLNYIIIRCDCVGYVKCDHGVAGDIFIYGVCFPV